MKLADMMAEIVKLVPDLFEETDKKEFDELKKLGLPREFADMYKAMSPINRVEVGRFVLLRLHDLINENIWDSPGEDLFARGFAVIGLSQDGNYFCLDLNKTNKLGFNDVVLADVSKDMSSIPENEMRKNLVHIHANFAGFLEKELKFMRKSLKT